MTENNQTTQVEQTEACEAKECCAPKKKCCKGKKALRCVLFSILAISIVTLIVTVFL